MPFVVREKWEIVVSREVRETLGYEDGERDYFAVEFALNDSKFLVDVTSCGSEFGGFYLYDDFPHVLEFISANKLALCRISLLAPRHDSSDNEYSVSSILKAYKGIDIETRQPAFVYECVNGKRFVDSPIAKMEGELKDLELVYLAALHDRAK